MTVDEDEKLSFIMKGLPPSYKDLKLSFLRQLDIETEELTVAKFKRQVKLHEEYCKEDKFYFQFQP